MTTTSIQGKQLFIMPILNAVAEIKYHSLRHARLANTYVAEKALILDDIMNFVRSIAA